MRNAEWSRKCRRPGYDAGDYNKYTVNSSYAVAFFVMAYELYPEYFSRLELNIPESGDSVPDLLDELKWNVDWMLSMQDPTDGGVYHKLSSLRFCGMIMPSEDDYDRYMIGKSTAAALGYAASLSAASRLYAKYEKQFPGYSRKLLDASRRAYTWAKANPRLYFNNPPGVGTGVYSDQELSDDFFYAAAQMFITTGEKKFYEDMVLVQNYSTPEWRNVRSLGLMELAIHVKELPSYANTRQINVKFKSLVDNIYNLYYYNVGKVAIKKFEWGSNGVVATNGAILGLGYKLLGDGKYMEGAQACFDYLLGRNSLDYCFVTGFGSRSPRNIHDRRSESDNIEDPLPGYLVGGPNIDETTDCGKNNYPSSIYPARAYLDEMCSYSTNEIAINWNAPFIMLAAEIVNGTPKGK